MSHHDSVEHSLFSQAREADSQIKRQSQTLSKLQYELETLKKTNAKRLKVSHNNIYIPNLLVQRHKIVNQLWCSQVV